MDWITGLSGEGCSSNLDAESVRWLGTLTAVYILGNTVRAEVAVQGQHILVDRLNGSQSAQFGLNEEVGLVVEKNACTVLAP